MAEKSLFWYTNGFTGDAGDGGAPYTQEEFRLFNHAWAAKNQANVGVFPGVLNELAVSGSATPLSVNTGRAVVYGFPYWADASVSLAITTPSVGTTGGRVVLRANWTAQTVRATVILNTDGTATIPSMTQSAGSVWDIPLATFTVTTGGVITLTDAREWALAGKPTKNLFVPCVGVENITDTTYYDEIQSRGPTMADNKATSGYGHFYVPDDYESGLTVTSIIRAAATGDVYGYTNLSYGASGEAWNIHSDFNGYTATAVTANENEFILPVTPASIAAGDLVRCQFARNGVDALDTIGNDVFIVGWLVTYTAQPLAATA